MNLDAVPTLNSLKHVLENVFELAGAKILNLDKSWDSAKGTPVFTAEGKYTTRGWTEWTQGFQFGMPILLFDATGERRFLELGRLRTVERMAPHVSHMGVHDHGFNNISTYGNLRRLMKEGKIAHNQNELNFYELALKVSGAVQAARWTCIPSVTASRPNHRDSGYIYSFNGPHSLFSDTIRSVRSLMLAHQLGHVLMSESDQPVSLHIRGLQHCLTTAHYNIYYGQGRDSYDTPDESGRTVHESIFNIIDGRYRCPSTQQGYSPFSTWTRGLAWVLCGFAEQLEFLGALTAEDWATYEAQRGANAAPSDDLFSKSRVLTEFHKSALATADWYLAHSFADGMVYWDAGAPSLPRPVNYNQRSMPYNDHEPIDSSAAAIAAQGFLRLANHLQQAGEKAVIPDCQLRIQKYRGAAIVIAQTLFSEPYLSTKPEHQGLILHSIYHRPNGWDYIPPGSKIPCGESSMWGDYHALELALLFYRELKQQPYSTFFDRKFK